MLIPIGFLNEHHEPNSSTTALFRNLVETAISRITWREGGLALLGTESGLRWNVGRTTGFNLANWDASSNEGRENRPSAASIRIVVGGRP